MNSLRAAAILLAVGSALLSGRPALAQDQFADQPPALYEVIVNGEHFLIEENRATKVESQAEPGKTYNLAVRVAEYQPWRLNTLDLYYHQAFAVRDDRGSPARTATFKHPLGFYMIVTDLGGAMPKENIAKAMDLVAESAQTSLTEAKAIDIKKSPVAARKFGDVESQGFSFSYKKHNIEGRTLAYVLTAPEVSATCVVEYLLEDQEDVLPLVRKTFESIRVLPKSAPAPAAPPAGAAPAAPAKP